MIERLRNTAVTATAADTIVSHREALMFRRAGHFLTITDMIAALDALRASPASGRVAVAAVTGEQAPRSATAAGITGLHYSRRASWVPSGLAER